ncbi:hypothetical protein GGF50DRAFT_115993 [Schizophyllum commune]
MADTAATDTGLFIFSYEGKRIVVPTPNTHEDALAVCRQHFAKDLKGAGQKVALYTSELPISPGVPIQVTPSAWAMVKTRVNMCEVTRGNPPKKAAGGQAPTTNSAASPLKRAHTRSRMSLVKAEVYNQPTLRSQPSSKKKTPGSVDYTPTPGTDAEHPLEIDPTPQIKAEEDDKYLLCAKHWTPHPSVELPPPAETYELFWATKLPPSGPHFSKLNFIAPVDRYIEQASRARTLKDNLDRAVLLYTNFAIADAKDTVLRSLVEEQTGVARANVLALDAMAAMERGSVRRLAFVIFDDLEARARMLASPVYTHAHLLVLARKPCADRSGLHRIFELVLTSNGKDKTREVDIGQIHNALHRALDSDAKALDRLQTTVRRRQVGRGFEVSVQFMSNYTHDDQTDDRYEIRDHIFRWPVVQASQASVVPALQW